MVNENRRVSMKETKQNIQKIQIWMKSLEGGQGREFNILICIGRRNINIVNRKQIQVES